MNKIIRWPGLIAFLIIAAGLIGGTVLFAAVLVENAIEYTGTRMVGARVDVGRVELSLSPIGFTVVDLQVTDPDKPMVNAFQIDEIHFYLDLHQLFLLKVVIPDMQVKRLRVNTERKESGAVLTPVSVQEAAEAEAEQEGEGFTFPSLEMPDLGDVFGREELKSLEYVNKLRVQVKEAQDQWQSSLASLPNKDKIKAYEDRLDKVKLGDSKDPVNYLKQLEKDIELLKALRKEVKGDSSSVNEARKQVQARLSQLDDSFAALKPLPAQDVDRIKSKYTLSPSGLANVSELLFGEKAGIWSRKIIVWYDKLKPIYARFEKAEVEEVRPARGKGINIAFPVHNKVPDFLVQKASISMEVALGKVSGEVRNMTGQQSVLGHPMTFHFFSKEMQDVQDVEIEGIFDHIHPAQSKDTVHVKVRSVQVKEMEVLKEDKFPLNLKSAVIDYEVNAELLAGKLQSEMTANFRDTDFNVPFAKSPPRLARAMSDAMDSVKAFDARMTVAGTLRKYDINIRSSLDEVLRKAIGDQVQLMARDFEQRIRAELERRIKEPMEDFRREQAKVKELLARLQNIEGEMKNLEGRLDARYKQVEKEYKDKLEARRKQAETEGKAKITEKKKEAKSKADEKTKEKREDLKQDLKKQLGL